MSKVLGIHLVVILTLFKYGFGERIKDKIYYDSGTINTCFRRLNATHQTGCSSDRGGNVGVLHYIESADDIEWLVNKGPHSPYVVLLAPLMFTLNTVQRLHGSKKINGMLVIYNATLQPEYFSPDTTCPNSNFELYKDDEEFSQCKKNAWNPDGNGLLMEDIKYPIISIHNHTHIDFFIKDCYEKFNKPNGSASRDYPLCGAEVKVEMDAIKDTPTCLRRGKTRNMNPQTFCDPLGDKNVYSFLHPVPYENADTFTDTLQKKSLIVAAAKLDAAGLFENLYPAADATVVGFITLLAAAEALYKVKDTLDPSVTRPIMFSFFQGESYDYIGSTRMTYDMERGEFPDPVAAGSQGPHPIHPHHVGSFLEVSQVALPTDSTLWMHSDPRSRRDTAINTETEHIEKILAGHGHDLGLDIRATDSELPLPPSSLQTFLRQSNLSGVVVADHNQQYNNKFYNSRLDLPLNLDYDVSDDNTTLDQIEYSSTNLSRHLTTLATVVARSLHELSKGQKQNETDISANESVIAQLLYCFFQTPRCDLFNYTVDEESSKILPKRPYSFYVGVDRAGVNNPLTVHVYRILSYFMGEDTGRNEANCSKAEDPYYQFVWMQGAVNYSDPGKKRVGVCMKTTTNQSPATSPAFDDGYDWASNKYAAWTESVWPNTTPNVRVFLLPDKNYEIMTLCIGLAVIVVSLPMVFGLYKKAPNIFAPN